MIDVRVPEMPLLAVKAVIEHVRLYGLRRLETGGFFLLPRDEKTVSTVAVAGTAGIVRRHNLFQISERALAQLFAYADSRDLWVPIQFHSHGRGALLSFTDVAHGFCVEGFVSVVIPDYATPTSDVTSWGWWCFSAGEWLPVEPAKVGTGYVVVVRFDEDGAGGA